MLWFQAILRITSVYQNNTLVKIHTNVAPAFLNFMSTVMSDINIYTDPYMPSIREKTHNLQDESFLARFHFGHHAILSIWYTYPLNLSYRNSVQGPIRAS